MWLETNYKEENNKTTYNLLLYKSISYVPGMYLENGMHFGEVNIDLHWIEKKLYNTMDKTALNPLQSERSQNYTSLWRR